MARYAYISHGQRLQGSKPDERIPWLAGMDVQAPFLNRQDRAMIVWAPGA